MKTNDLEYVGYDYNFLTGKCQYQARYDHSSAARDVDRTLDGTYSLASVDWTCSSAPIAFPGTDYYYSDYKEWDLMWRLKKHQSYMATYVHPYVSGYTNMSIHGEVGAHPISNCDGKNACYNDTFKVAYFIGVNGDNISPGPYTISTIAHEYGHHVQNMYGFRDFTGCTTTNHRKLIMQLTATIAGNALAVDSHKGVAHHYMLGDGIITQHSETDNTAPPTYSFADNQCDQNSNKLAEPFWEIIHDVNCLDEICTHSWNYQGYNSVGYSESFLRKVVVRAVAFSNLLAPSVGSTYTVQTAAATMRTYMYSQLNSSGDLAVTRIMSHHGL